MGEHKLRLIPQDQWSQKPVVNMVESEKPIKLILENFQSPGDIVCLTAAIRDLHKSYPDWFQTDVRSPCPAIWEGNPYIQSLHPQEEGVVKIRMEYPLVHSSNTGPYHFIHGFRKFLEDKLGVVIKAGPFRGDIHISKKEKSWYSQIHELLGADPPFWILNAGSKTDFTAKQWERERFQELVGRLPEVLFVQVGEGEHRHEVITGQNVINLVGKTDLRQLIRLVYHSAGVVSPVSLPMHLAAAVEMNPRYNRKNRPCVVLAGGREPSVWEAYTHHQYLHTCGAIPCCDEGGCWKSRVFEGEIGDGDEKDKINLCAHPVDTPSGQKVPLCMDMISVDQVENAIRTYLEPYDYHRDLL